MKIKGTTWIILFCPFLTLIYIILKINNITLTRHVSLIGIGNTSDIKVNVLTSSRKNNSYQMSIVKATGKKSLHDGINEKNNDERSVTVHKIVSYSSSNTNEHRVSLSHKTNNSSLENVNVNILGNDKIKIGILIPSSTRKLKSPILENLSLTTTCLPSIFKTLENIYEYVIYIGIDKGDYLETVIKKLEKLENVRTVVSHGWSFTTSVNTIARKAYQEGMDYLVRVNDDSSFETSKWTSEGINVLKKYTPMNIGVVGPTCHQGNTAILTHDMVHRTHLEIFDFYHPSYFDNWWADDWITKVYSPDRSTKLSTWIVKHHTGSHYKRYNVDFKKETRLVKILEFDTERLNEYISNMNQTFI